MTDRLARLVGALGCLCLEFSEWLSPLKVEPPSVESIMQAVEKDSWRVTSMAQPEAAAVQLVEQYQRPVYLAPSWAMLDRQAFVVETGTKAGAES